MSHVATNSYPRAMTPDPETDYDPPRKFRIPDSEWAPFERATKAVHDKGRSPRAKVLREFVNWYMRRPGAALPKRPDAGPWSDPDWMPPQD